MIYAIFDGEFVEVKSMYKKSNGGPTYYSIWVVGSDGEYYAKKTTTPKSSATKYGIKLSENSYTTQDLRVTPSLILQLTPNS